VGSTCRYNFAASVQGANGHASGQTYTVGISVPSAPQPQPQTRHTVDLFWRASTSSNVISYDVYRGTVAGGPYQRLASGIASTLYTDATVTSGTTYYYVVTAVNNLNRESGYSSRVAAVVPIP
jgi:fibronectin type 3 domain-containing protein